METEEHRLEVICDDSLENPHCEHGPTLLFRKYLEAGSKIEEFYACSAYRSLDKCGFYERKVDQVKDRRVQNGYHVPTPRGKLILNDKSKVSYCHSCNVLFKEEETNLHEGHDFIRDNSEKPFQYPTRILRPLSDDKAEAQYFFDDKTLDFLGNCMISLGIGKVVCIGAPRLHEYLTNNRQQFNIESFLMDLDKRFLNFFEDKQFALFNMFNFHFFEGTRKLHIFQEFLKVKSDESVLIFTDPPFGCRTEPLINTMDRIKSLYQRINSTNAVLPIFWVFPYFMETYIKRFKPEMEMLDYKINYTNHKLYHDGYKGRKYGSPIRIFTNIPTKLIEFPESEGYKFCNECQRWTGNENNHCKICKKCPSKNGEVYRHCPFCEICVKPNYKHCNKCGRCTQKTNHSCEEYQKHLRCWICRFQGHTESKCTMWRNFTKQNKNLKCVFNRASKAIKKGGKMCLICAKIGHNEMSCPKRKFVLKEKIFMNEIVNIFNKNSVLE